LTGPFGSAAYLGAACCLVAPAALGVALDERRRPRWRWAAAVSAASALFGAVGSGSRAAWLALLVVGCVTGWRARHNRSLPKIAAAAALIIALAALATPVGSRVASTADSTAAGGVSRLEEWRVGVATLAHHPLVGAGPEGYRIVFRDGVDAAYEREHGRSVQPDRAHNGLLDIALAGGVPAAILYAAFVVTAAMSVRRRLLATAPSPALLGALAAITAYLLQQQLLFPLAELEPVLFLLAGGVVCSGQPTVRLSRLGARTGAAAAAVLAVAALWWGARDIAAWHAAHAAAGAQDRAKAQRHALDAISWRGDEVWLHLLAARSAPTPEAALAAVDDALALSAGDPIALLRRQELLVTLDPAAAFEELHDLVADDPNNAALQLLYGTAAVRTGDEAIAERAWLRALDLAPESPGPRHNLITLYRGQGRDAEANALEDAGTDGQ
jgi:tetratricopeptide (TPR) repeat protein